MEKQKQANKAMKGAPENKGAKLRRGFPLLVRNRETGRLEWRDPVTGEVLPPPRKDKS